MKKRILITGGSGLLGVNWAIAMRDQFEVYLGLHNRNIEIRGVYSRFLDLQSEDSAKKYLHNISPEIVIHAAGLTSVEECEKSCDDAEELNVSLAGNVASACAQLGMAMVHISTDHLFFGDCPMQSEDDLVRPRNVYAKTKAVAEILVSQACPTALIVRTNFYGWGPYYRRSFSDYILDALRTGQKIKLFDDVHYTPILAEALATTVHELLRMEASGLFQVVGDERISKYEFGRKIASQFNLDERLLIPVSIRERKDLVDRPLDMSLSNNKACELLGKNLGDVNAHLTRLKQQEQLGLKNEILLM